MNHQILFIKENTKRGAVKLSSYSLIIILKIERRGDYTKRHIHTSEKNLAENKRDRKFLEIERRRKKHMSVWVDSWSCWN